MRKILIFICLLFFTTAAHAEPPIYYIGPNGQYASIAAFKSAVPSPAVGSQVYLECGNTFVVTSQWDINWTGDTSNKVVIGAYYYTGSTKIIGISGTRPILSGSNYTYPSGTIPVYAGLMRIYDKDHVTIKDLWFTQSRGCGLKIGGASNNANISAQYFIVENCYFTDNYMTAIEIAYCANNHGIVRGNYIYNNVLAGNRKLNLFPNHPFALMLVGSPNAYTTFEKNALIGNWGETLGIYAYDANAGIGCSHAIIRDNYLGGTSAPLVYLDGVSYIDVYRNVLVGGNYNSSSGTLDGVAFANVGISVNNEIYPEGSTPTVYNSGQSHDINIWGNFIADVAYGIGIGDEVLGNVVSNVKIFNNSIVAAYKPFDRVGSSAVFSNCEMKNNLVYRPTGTVQQANENEFAGLSGWTLDNNAGKGPGWGTNYVTITDADIDDPLGADWNTITLSDISSLVIQPSYFAPASGSGLEDAGIDLGDDFKSGANQLTGIWPSSPQTVDFDVVGWPIGALNIISADPPPIASALDATNAYGGATYTPTRAFLFDDASGTTLTDHSAAGADATLTNPIWDANGLTMSSTGQLAAAPMPNMGATWTAFIAFTSTATYAGDYAKFFYYYNATVRDWQLERYTSDTEIRSDIGNVTQAWAPVPDLFDQYFHTMMITFNDTTDTRCIYIDGTFQSCETATYTSPTWTGYFYIGGKSDGSRIIGATFHAFYIWPNVLTYADAAALHADYDQMFTDPPARTFNLPTPAAPGPLRRVTTTISTMPIVTTRSQ